MSDLDRRRFLHRTGLALGAAATVPLLGTGVASASAVNPDELFKAGRFAEAEHGYRRQLHGDPDHAHAAARIGYLALLANRFADAERYLTRAVTLAPDDTFSRYQLADTYVRQDRLTQAVPWLRSTGNPVHEAYAKVYERIRGVPWQVHGPSRTQVPLLGIDPLPHLEVSINGGRPGTYLLDTGATTVGFTMDVASAAGLEVISTSTAVIEGRPIPMYHGIARSVRIGDIEVRNCPVHWNEAVRPELPGGNQPLGTVGTTFFYHFLTTVDYGHQRFVLRRKSGAERVEALRAGGDLLPLWLAKDHFPLTLGKINDLGPGVATFDTGGPGRALGMSLDVAERAGVEVGEAEDPGNGQWRYPVRPERSSLGRAVRRRAKGWAQENPKVDDGLGFDTIGNFTHEFFEPFAITLDFTGMNLLITGDSLDPDVLSAKAFEQG